MYKHPIKNFITKFSDWEIREPSTATEVLVLGDSNVARITLKPCKQIDIQAFHGAKITHMAAVLKKRARQPMDSRIKHVILSVGTNDAFSSSPIHEAEQDIRRMSSLAKEKFPHATVSLAEIPVSITTAPKRAERMTALNEMFHKLRAVHIIPHPPRHSITLHVRDKAGIHWSPESANKILSHWYQSLN